MLQFADQPGPRVRDPASKPNTVKQNTNFTSKQRCACRDGSVAEVSIAWHEDTSLDAQHLCEKLSMAIMCLPMPRQEDPVVHWSGLGETQTPRSVRDPVSKTPLMSTSGLHRWVTHLPDTCAHTWMTTHTHTHGKLILKSRDTVISPRGVYSWDDGMTDCVVQANILSPDFCRNGTLASGDVQSPRSSAAS